MKEIIIIFNIHPTSLTSCGSINHATAATIFIDIIMCRSGVGFHNEESKYESTY
jgi:hypothetical protein